MPLDCQLGIVAMWGEWEGFVKWLMECCRVEVWSKTRCWLVLVLAGDWEKGLYKLGCDRERLKMIKGGHKDHVSACLCHMLYCIETSTRYNLAFFVLKRMEKTQSKPKELLPYGMLFTRLFKHVTRSDRGKKRPRESNASSSSTILNHPSSSYPLDALDENDDASFHFNSSSSSQNISSTSNVVSRVHQKPPHESHYLNTHLSETINLQTQQRDAHRKGLRSIGQALKNMMGGKRK
ncbi:hypothetical protein Tco_0842472 [Tanacetum coccineum]|uniref:Pentatricopeptide repeat-containing protein n=1 Tax=Tanacetum coccineum TaxID=301880 RepID=A0ABQ5AZD6_9ASTR